MHCGLVWTEGIPSIFEKPLPVSLHSPNGRQKLPAISAVQEDCEIVYWDVVCDLIGTEQGGSRFTNTRQNMLCSHLSGQVYSSADTVGYQL